MKRHHYTEQELDAAALRDLLNDAQHAEAQAESGPFYPERDVTAESLLAYAARCRACAAKHETGGAHAAVLRAPLGRAFVMYDDVQ